MKILFYKSIQKMGYFEDAFSLDLGKQPFKGAVDITCEEIRYSF